MTGGVGTSEVLRLKAAPRARTAPHPDGPAPLHEYGRLEIFDEPGRPRGGPSPLPEAWMSETEALGAAALSLRNSEAYRAEKAERSHEGLSWGMEASSPEDPEPLRCDIGAAAYEADAGERIRGAPLSARLSGRVAVGLIIVSGPTPQLAFSRAEKSKIGAEIQEAGTFLAMSSPAGDVTFSHHVRSVTVEAPETPAGVAAPANDPYAPWEAPWRDAVLTGLGLPPGGPGIRSYAEQLRAALETDWAYVAFVTKYRLRHYAYAVRSQAKVVMSFFDGNLRPNEMDWTFAHETGHIFGAPDEYAPCQCGGDHGHFHLPNSNCETCAPAGAVQCIMRQRTLKMCPVTPYHFGYKGLPPFGAGV